MGQANFTPADGQNYFFNSYPLNRSNSRPWSECEINRCERFMRIEANREKIRTDKAKKNAIKRANRVKRDRIRESRREKLNKIHAVKMREFSIRNEEHMVRFECASR